MVAYDSDPVNPHACGEYRGSAHGAIPSSGAAARGSIWQVAVRAQRAL